MNVHTERRRALIAAQAGEESSGIPAGYQQVQYLTTEQYDNSRTSEKAPYIDVPVAFQNGDVFTTQTKLTASTYDYDTIIGNPQYYQLYYSNSKTDIRQWSRTNDSTTPDIAVSATYGTIDTATVTVSGIGPGSYTYGVPDLSHFYINAYIIQRSLYLMRGRVYSVQLRRDGVLRCDLVPCYRKSDSKPGMYDLVNRAFYPAAGKGYYTLGPNTAT